MNIIRYTIFAKCNAKKRFYSKRIFFKLYRYLTGWLCFPWNIKERKNRPTQNLIFLCNMYFICCNVIDRYWYWCDIHLSLIWFVIYGFYGNSLSSKQSQTKCKPACNSQVLISFLREREILQQKSIQFNQHTFFHSSYTEIKLYYSINFKHTLFYNKLYLT